MGCYITACRWLYPHKEKESITVKEKVAQSKKQAPQQRLEWVPLKDNPSGIGSSVAFQDPNHVPTPTVMETYTEPVASLQQQLTHPMPVDPPSLQQQLTHPVSVAPPSPHQQIFENEVSCQTIPQPRLS